ncbi:response regulator [Chloroflexota bacterium]
MMEKTNILVVDDLRSMRLTLGGILEDEGHNVVTAEDGYQAIEAVRKTHFDIIFMDIKMPGIDGVQAFREIKKIDPRAAVVMMTAYSVEDLVKEALTEGAHTVVYKSFDIARIMTIIEELARQRILILVVDDQVGDRETLRVILEDKGYRVATARDGAETIEMVKSRHYDIIFLDMRLPDMNGVETYEQFKEFDPRATVIMMTGHSEDDLVKRAINQGALTCVYKPYDMDKVVALVEDIANEKKE